MTPEQDLELARRFAPVIRFTGDEPYAPMAPDVFVRESRLVWRTSARKASEIAGEGAVAASRLGSLGSRPYDAPEAGLTAIDFTRPFDTRPERGALAPDRGFGLVHRDIAPGRVDSTAELRRRVEESPAFFELERLPSGQTLLCYWLFFGSSTYPLGFLSWKHWIDWLRARLDDDDPDDLRTILAAQMPPPGRRPLDAGDIRRLVRDHVVHQGDWEGVTLVLGDDAEPSHAIYRAHADHAVTRWQDVEREADVRPVVLCAKGSHASYPAADRLSRDYNDVLPAKRGAVRWDVGELLLPAREQEWFGYGGSWGDPDLDASWLRVDLPAASKEFSGPLGPSPFKSLAKAVPR